MFVRLGTQSKNTYLAPKVDFCICKRMMQEKAAKKLRFCEEVQILEERVVKGSERVGNFGRYEDLVNSLQDDQETQEVTDLSTQQQDMGYQIEPFNMEREKREGYFDQQGHYIQFRRFKDQEEDAWWQQVMEEGGVSGKLQQLRRSALFDTEDIPEMSKEQAQEFKEEIFSTLQHGETVLDALRRLAQQPKQHLQGRKRVRGGWTCDRSKKEFYRLVELADMLLHNGDHNIYTTPKTEAMLLDEQMLNAITISDDQQEMVVEEDGLPESDEFILDSDTGWLYNSQQGWYYDAQNQLFGDAATGLWYKYKDGDYHCIQSS
eukprot:TRINITY_DN23717_c0_g1_i2.p1 TRINITY_DN23717_c0_g1~~TRINITY_DN23717_c0_g1_i2.p1  ORF type:complete len:319 (+),score=55.97 TRINITY_DN23717_c0_g1_i2:64-1020(+)